MHTLANVPLSAEAKAVVAQAYYTGVALEVSTIINLKGRGAFDQEFLRELIIAGWGEQLGQYVEIIEAQDATNYEALRLVQLAVRSGDALFAFCNVRTGSNQRCYLSIHHALADEQTLKNVSRLVELAHIGMPDIALHDISQGRQSYYSYVERQQAIEKEDILLKKSSGYPMKPVRLSESGSLAWSTKAKRVCLSRIVRIENADKLPITAVLTLLRRTDVMLEGNTVCLSQCWRLAQESGAIGMMTGLIAMPIDCISNPPTQFQTSLEACARYNSDVRRALECCRASELFINGAATRGIPASQVISTTFPVGIDIRRINDSEFRLEFEGQFRSKNAVNDLLNELADLLSYEKEGDE